ncbi:hypothetical protein [Roseateles oligotrophus]|uniref:N-acetyltransferase domain-containing protein n=1 Tax=Roseateles oligotrophus TaxID=1769250 RepID=A0ABT2Y9A2_9BURK|nr:hypothetical protein [Roseateles oligotrophus]MCV2366863.1 hypothetical protein [Roseateles oligotrophus]
MNDIFNSEIKINPVSLASSENSENAAKALFILFDNCREAGLYLVAGNAPHFALERGVRRCGSKQTPELDGEYRLILRAR